MVLTSIHNKPGIINLKNLELCETNKSPVNCCFILQGSGWGLLRTLPFSYHPISTFLLDLFFCLESMTSFVICKTCIIQFTLTFICSKPWAHVLCQALWLQALWGPVMPTWSLQPVANMSCIHQTASWSGWQVSCHQEAFSDRVFRLFRLFW